MSRTRLQSVLIGAIGSCLFIGLAALYRDFVLDDAFITYRYAQHLAQHQGLTWNVGQDPVEGYTSWLWVILNAVGFLARLDPVQLSKGISLIAALAIIWTLALAYEDLHWGLRAIFVGALAVSPVFALLTMQGMETTLAALLVLGSAQLALTLTSRPVARRMVAWYGLALLSFWARPDSAAFSLGVFIGLIAAFIRRRETASLRRFIVTGIPFGIAGAVYMAWRSIYFGYLLPNTFYIKAGGFGCRSNECGLSYVASFVLQVFLPYLALTAILMAKRTTKERLAQTIPILSGCTLFLLYILWIDPIQGFLWRFIFPIYPALLSVCMFCLAGTNANVAWAKRPWLSAIVLLCFAIWTLRLLPDTLREAALRTQRDRVIVGQALAGLPGTMFVTESGALPFYSGWYAIDALGLNSEEIAHRGLSSRVLADLDPDLIMALRIGQYQRPSQDETRMVINQYMVDHGFVAVAVIRKSEGRYHYYFARGDSPLFDEITQRLRNIEGIDYANLSEMMRESRIPAYGSR